MDIFKPTEPALSWKHQASKLTPGERTRILHRLASLEGALQRVLEEVRDLNDEVEQYGVVPPTTQIDYFSGKLRVDTHKLFTKGGSVRGIRQKITETLAVRRESMTSEQLAETLYSFDPKVSFDLFKRRVIVAVSAMHRMTPPMLVPDQGRKGKGREVFWNLNPYQNTKTTPEDGLEMP